MDTETQDLGATRKAFKCDQCKERFASMIGLKNHVQSDHKKAKELPKMHKMINHSCQHYTSNANNGIEPPPTSVLRERILEVREVKSEMKMPQERDRE